MPWDCVAERPAAGAVVPHNKFGYLGMAPRDGGGACGVRVAVVRLSRLASLLPSLRGWRCRLRHVEAGRGRGGPAVVCRIYCLPPRRARHAGWI